ncbi:MAG: response regulator [Chitinispirillaceae bacterium]|nr:response regulator [Chitinispirillaceae bacterium]
MNASKPSLSSYSVLVVDDEERIRTMLEGFFRGRGYHVRLAADGVAALAAIEEQIPDIVLSDIRMPVMDGIELFRVIRERFQRIRHVLMTSYNVDDYLALIRQHNIGNILVKGPEFNLAEVDECVRSLLTGDIFGLGRYFPGRKLTSTAIDSYARSEEVCSMVEKQCGGSRDAFLHMAVDELIANAVFHGVLRLTGIPREQWQGDIALDADSAITVTWARDGEKIGVSVEDHKGNLKKVDALRWLDKEDQSGREREEHGRGLYLVRRFIDRFIINIDPGRRTECIVIQHFNRDHLHTFKPLLINEI